MTTSTITECAGLIAAIALLAPLVRAVSKWHTDIQKMSKAAKPVTTRQRKTSAEATQAATPSEVAMPPEVTTPPDASGAKRAGSLPLYLIFIPVAYCLFMIFLQSRSSEPLTRTSVAMIAIAAVIMCASIVVGYIAWMLIAVSRQLNEAIRDYAKLTNEVIRDYAKLGIDASLMVPRVLSELNKTSEDAKPTTTSAPPDQAL